MTKVDIETTMPPLTVKEAKLRGVNKQTKMKTNKWRERKYSKRLKMSDVGPVTTTVKNNILHYSFDKAFSLGYNIRMTSNPEYSRMYYLTHIRKIKARKKLYYANNRERIIAHQIDLNRKTRDVRRAARASQKPIRKYVRRVPKTDPDSSRDTSTISGISQPESGEHGDFVQLVSRDYSPSTIRSVNDGVSSSETKVVPEQIPSDKGMDS